MTIVEEMNSAENEEVDMGSDKDDSADDDFDSDSSSDDYDSSDLSCSEYEKLSDEYSSQLNVLEEHFYQIREAYKKEKLSHLNWQLIQLVEEKSPEFTQPLEELNESKTERIQTAGHVRNLRNHYAQIHFEAEMRHLEQDFVNEKVLLKDRIKQIILEKIKKLNEDRNKADNEYASESNFSKRSRKYSGTYPDEFGEKRRKPVTVTGPYVVYMLKDEEIMEDLSYISCFARPLRSYSHLNYGY